MDYCTVADTPGMNSGYEEESEWSKEARGGRFSNRRFLRFMFPSNITHVSHICCRCKLDAWIKQSTFTTTLLPLIESVSLNLISPSHRRIKLKLRYVLSFSHESTAWDSKQKNWEQVLSFRDPVSNAQILTYFQKFLQDNTLKPCKLIGK